LEEKSAERQLRWETTNLAIAYDTPLSIVEQMRSRISHYITENNREWNNSSVWIEKMEFQNAIHLTIGLEREFHWFLPVFTVVNWVPTLRSPQLARLGRPLGTPQCIYEMVEGGLGRTRPQVHCPDSTRTVAKRQPILRCRAPASATLTLQGFFFGFEYWDVPRRRSRSFPYPNNALDKTWFIFLIATFAT